MAVLSTYQAGSADGQLGYDITINFTGGNWTEANQAAFISAADYITTIIIGDLSNFNRNVTINGSTRSFNVDDLEIDAALNAIDGLSGTLGRAGPRLLRNSPGQDEDQLTIWGEMEFDTAEFQVGGVFNDPIAYENTILHEMLHVIGIGTLWDRKGLVTGLGTADPRYIGANGVFEYEALYPTEFANDANSAAGVPVEADGGSGTAYSHWDEAVFDKELMTGYLDSDAVFSNMSIGSLADLGYETTYVPTCFTPGTRILTERGEMPVEALRPGMRVWTQDHGWQPLLYVTDSIAPQAALAARPNLRPIRLDIPDGEGRSRSILLSRQHRVLVSGAAAERMFGSPEVLVPVKDFLTTGHAWVEWPQGDQRYLNLLFARHQIIQANGLWCESLYFGAQTQLNLSDLDRAAIRALIKAGWVTGEADAPARPLVRGKRAQNLLTRLQRNGKPLQPHVDQPWV